jgi:hypothetical protein
MKTNPVVVFQPVLILYDIMCSTEYKAYRAKEPRG